MEKYEAVVERNGCLRGDGLTDLRPAGQAGVRNTGLGSTFRHDSYDNENPFRMQQKRHRNLSISMPFGAKELCSDLLFKQDRVYPSPS